jgi:hypothetical protein
MESLIALYRAIDAYLGKPYRALLRGEIAGFAETQAGLYRALGERQAMQKSFLTALWAQGSWRGRWQVGRKLLRARAQQVP